MKNIISCFLMLIVCIACNKNEVKEVTGTPDIKSSPSSTLSAKFIIQVTDLDGIRENDAISLVPEYKEGKSYLYTLGNAQISSEKNPSFSYPKHGIYTITLTVKDKNGNEATTCQKVTILCNRGGTNH